MNHRIKADIFTQLAAMEHAGVSPQQTFRALAQTASAADRKPLETAAALAGRGRSLGTIGKHTGLFDRVDAEILQAASVAGRIEQAYRRLAERHNKADLRRRQMRGKLMLPALVLLVAAFVRPFQAFFLGELDLLGYLAAALGPVVLVASAVFLAPRLWRTLKSARIGRSLQALALDLPGLGRLETLRNRSIYLDTLALLIESGVPALKALAIAAGTVPNQQARAVFDRLRVAVEAGKPLHRAFDTCPLMDSRSTRLLAAGEVSGSLGDMLTRIAAMTGDDLEGLQDALATWVPRIAYLMVAIWILSGLSPTAFAPQMPEDL
ncbi:hypothetical protein G3480_15180 [Thiorhodococcus mannitoliphagus]|uniref:Type II secretion system protein GspF domain-containing protein n=1 Tax=Thiorhodococcus mannitoliphagus TaxID=329406 RepID=A0A6P1DY36_9GAMM|nr:type II secretion system F family protein [Thiorhodococcus mannitoliphagus]NEX21636.1 hypothetical protein [Thiorhodococcus mannitoliphagus]